jgi:hypothetical protein
MAAGGASAAGRAHASDRLVDQWVEAGDRRNCSSGSLITAGSSSDSAWYIILVLGQPRRKRDKCVGNLVQRARCGQLTEADLSEARLSAAEKSYSVVIPYHRRGAIKVFSCLPSVDRNDQAPKSKTRRLGAVAVPCNFGVLPKSKPHSGSRSPTPLSLMRFFLRLTLVDAVDSGVDRLTRWRSSMNCPSCKGRGVATVEVIPGLAIPHSLGGQGSATGTGRGQAHGCAMPAASLVHNRLAATIARGWAALDWSALGLLAASDAGLPSGIFSAPPLSEVPQSADQRLRKAHLTRGKARIASRRQGRRRCIWR